MQRMLENKTTKLIAVGLFVVAMLLNVSVFVDSGNSQKADLTMGDLSVSLFQKAQAGEGVWICFGDNGPGCIYDEDAWQDYWEY